MKLHDLKPNRGSRKPGRRVGRGSGSGRGKTSGRGEKGQKSRSGFSRKRGFEGGQMPLHRRLPKRGFTNIHRVEITAVNLSRLKEVPAGTDVTLDYLRDQGLVPHKTKLLKILGVGEVSGSLTVRAHKFSKTAASKIEAAGGQVVALEIPKKGPGPKVAKGGAKR